MSVPALRFVWMAIFIALALSAASLLIPVPAYAVGSTADAMCAPFFPQCPCGTVPSGNKCVGGKNTANCPVGVCVDVTNEQVTAGVCVAAGKCEAVTTGGAGVDSGLKQLAEQLGKMLGDLLKGNSSQDGQQSASQGNCPGGYYQTSVPTSDPCAQYVAPTSAQIDTSALGTGTGSSALLNSLLGNTGPIGSSALIDLTTGTGTGSSGQINLAGDTPAGTTFKINSLISSQSGNDNPTSPANTSNTPNAVTSGTASPSGTKASSGGATSIRNVVTMSDTSTNPNTDTKGDSPDSPDAPSAVPPESGVSGDITLGEGGATVTAGTTDADKNTTVAGFYGSDTPGGQSQGLAARWCESRPWAGNFLSVIIPPTFFDNLCTWRGYKVGPEEAPAPTLQQTAPAPAPKPPAPPPTATSTAPTVTPRVDIWAVPPTVPLDTRTSIFWNTQGVTECTETSPDGSFNHTTLSGGAATVPLVRATTFTISCLVPDGSYVSGYVTVNIAI